VLEPKTAVLALLLAEAGAEIGAEIGAEVIVFAHPDETDDDVAAALRADGLTVFARSSATAEEHLALAREFLAQGLTAVLDDGSSIIRLAHLDSPAVFDTLIAAAEETTSGLRPLHVLQREGGLRIPVVAVNDARSKTLFDNLYGTGQSCVFAILDVLARDRAVRGEPVTGLAGASVVIAGFGPVGEGTARHAAALGAMVTIAETDPVRALRARFEGYQVAPLVQAAASADLVISATGIADTISFDVLVACKADAVVAVAGGVPQEIAIDAAVAAGALRETIGQKIERFTLPGGGRVRILDDGGCINITAGEGNPIEIMDLSFGVQLAAVRFLLEHVGTLTPGIYPLPPLDDDRVAAAALAHSGLAIEVASAAQQNFLASWAPTRFSALNTAARPDGTVDDNS
jgi:adenosylhomocysteinase